MTLDDRAVTVDRATRQQILDDAGYKCQLGYRNICTAAATELADVGVLKAACKECRRAREGQRARGNKLHAAVLRRGRSA